jgi:hypothetical protein
MLSLCRASSYLCHPAAYQLAASNSKGVPVPGQVCPATMRRLCGRWQQLSDNQNSTQAAVRHDASSLHNHHRAADLTANYRCSPITATSLLVLAGQESQFLLFPRFKCQDNTAIRNDGTRWEAHSMTVSSSIPADAGRIFSSMQQAGLMATVALFQNLTTCCGGRSGQVR